MGDLIVQFAQAPIHFIFDNLKRTIGRAPFVQMRFDRRHVGFDSASNLRGFLGHQRVGLLGQCLRLDLPLHKRLHVAGQFFELVLPFKGSALELGDLPMECLHLLAQRRFDAARKGVVRRSLLFDQRRFQSGDLAA